MNFITGFIVGVVFVTLGATGIMKMIDNGVITIQETVKEIAK
jgi:hypothetical protein